MRELRNRDIGTLLVMLAIAEHGSINKAAKALFITQPALTRTVREFESAVGGQVFERTARGVTTTPFGEALLAHARTIRAEAQLALQQAERVRADGRQHVFLGAAPYHPLSLLSRALDAVMTAHPRIGLHLRYESQPTLLEMLHRGEIEAVLGPLASGEDAHGLLQEVLFHDEMGVYCRAGHPLAGGSSVQATALREAAWVLGPMGSMVRSRVDGLFWSHGVVPPDVRLEVADVGTRRSLVVNTAYLSAFQTDQIHAEVESGAVVRLPIPWPQEHQPIGVIRLRGHTALSRSIIEIIRRIYTEAGMATPGSDPLAALDPG